MSFTKIDSLKKVGKLPKFDFRFPFYLRQRINTQTSDIDKISFFFNIKFYEFVRKVLIRPIEFHLLATFILTAFGNLCHETFQIQWVDSSQVHPEAISNY